MSRGSKAAARGRDTAILLVSQEPFLLSEAERDLRDRLIPPGERDLNYLALYAWETDIGQVLEFLQTLPFLGNGRLLVLREVQKFQDLETLKGYLADPNPTSCLLMTSSQLKKTDALFRALSALSETSELKNPREEHWRGGSPSASQGRGRGSTANWRRSSSRSREATWGSFPPK
ncbi:MAG: hypothetical protein JSV00_08995 [bacterium]|nr:MAG: hypothetical protein JSV00_08995 [bacterium]